MTFNPNGPHRLSPSGPMFDPQQGSGTLQRCEFYEGSEDINAEVPTDIVDVELDVEGIRHILLSGMTSSETENDDAGVVWEMPGDLDGYTIGTLASGSAIGPVFGCIDVADVETFQLTLTAARTGGTGSDGTALAQVHVLFFS